MGSGNRHAGVLDTPFPRGLDAPQFAETKERLMRHFDSTEELNAFLHDADALADAMSSYIWSLGQGGD